MSLQLATDHATQAFEKIEELYNSLNNLKTEVTFDRDLICGIPSDGILPEYQNSESRFYLRNISYIQNLPESLQEILSGLIDHHESFMERADQDIKSNLNLESGSVQEQTVSHDLYLNCAKSLENDIREIISLTQSISSEVKEVFDSKTKKKTIIDGKCLLFLVKAYAITSRPSKSERALIASNCGLTENQVRVWFTNRRIRHPPKTLNTSQSK